MVEAQYERIPAILLLFVAIIALWKTRGLSEMSYIFPRTIGIIFLLLSFIYLIFAFLAKENKALFHDIDKKKVFTMGLGLIVYAMLIVILGFLFASILYISSTTLYLQWNEKNKDFRKKVTHAAIFAISISVVFYLLFQYVFLIQLPSSMLIR